MFTLIFRGFAEWMFIIGVYGVTRELVTKPYTWLPPLSQLAMPFYLSHQQVLIIIAAGASWYPHLSKYKLQIYLVANTREGMGTSGNLTTLDFFGFRILSGCPDPVNNWNPAGILGDHQGGTHQIFLWPPYQ